MNSYAPEIFASGTLKSINETTIYVVPRHSRVTLSALSLINSGSASITVNVAIKEPGSASRSIIPKNQILHAGDMVQVTAPHSIPAQGSLVLAASTPGVLEYTFSGIKLPSIPVPTDRAQ